MNGNETRVDARHLIALRAAPEFAGLDADAIAALAQIFDERVLPRGAQVARAGVPLGAAVFVLDGRVRIERPLPKIVDHGPIGILELLAEDPAGLEARTETDAHVLWAPAAALHDLLEEHFGFMMASLRGLARAGLVFLERQPPDTWLLPPRQPPDCRPEASTLELAERILWMDQAMYFANSRVDAVADIARISKDVRWSAGAPLWRRGEDADGFVLVISGEVEISYTTGRALASVGQTLGGIESLADLPHWYDAVATTPVRALHSTRDAILDVIEDQADLGVDMVRFLAARLLRLRGGAST